MSRDPKTSVLVVGSGVGGLVAALRAHALGAEVTLIEKAAHVGGATAWSGGQVWVGANHVARRLGIADTIEDALRYVAELASPHPELFDEASAREWLFAAREAALWLEEIGAIQWAVIPDYPDYYYPNAPGSAPTGRYLTSAPFSGAALGEARGLLLDSPHWPVGITYEEMFAWGGLSSRDRWDHETMAARRRDDVMTFGQGIAGWLLAAVVQRSITMRVNTSVEGLVVDQSRVVGVRCRDATGEFELEGSVILATGAHDWSDEARARWFPLEAEDGGSVAPSSVAGDALAIAEGVGAAVGTIPATAAPIIPGYRLLEPQFEGDSRYRACFEHCLPHTIMVNRRGERFCDDSFHSAIIAKAMESHEGDTPNLPFFMIWDSQHHQKYGLGRTMPAMPYPEGLVTRGETIEELAEALGVDAMGLMATVERFNSFAAGDVDEDFGRGSNLSVRRFRGDNTHEPNPNMGPITQGPFFGMRMRLLNTGIAAGGLETGSQGRVLRSDGAAIDGLFAAGECVARTNGGGSGYNSGYSISRAMAYGYLAAQAAIADET